ncbi:MAG: putative L-aspartate dehydrogenase [Rhodospirillales bacterium]|nr:putative L-aspartate dehydrogenase [Rhodospirillales bacterium]
MRIALIGTGSIAASLRQAFAQRGIQLVAALCRREPDQAWGDVAVRSLAALFETAPDLVVECAGHEAVAQFAPAVLARGIDLVVASTGALADPSLEAELRAPRAAGRLFLPAGALGGIDAIAAASRGALAHVSLTTTKTPRGWGRESALRETLFDGTAREAALAWPKNANVAATLALAGLGFDATRVTLVADPAAAGNTHRIEAEGEFGRLVAETTGLAAPDNPRTSRLTALSILRVVEQRDSLVVL